MTSVPDKVSEARDFLKKQSERTGFNVYDHLIDVVHVLLSRRPVNAADFIESISSYVKRSKFNLGTHAAPLGFRKLPDSSLLYAQIQLLQPFVPAGPREDDEIEEAGQIPDILDLARLFEWTGNALGREEAFQVTLSVRQLVNKRGLKSARFWGKIYGLNAPYYIVEAEGAPTIDQGSTTSLSEGVEETNQKIVAINSSQLTGFPNFTPQNPIKVPPEQSSGCNKYAYFVTNVLGKEWQQLPNVLPEHIVCARGIRKYLSGNLASLIVSYPSFPGNEACYLRAQIARITASTVVCPAGYYTFDPEGADEENPDSNTSIIVNTENEMFPNESMLNLDNWVHQMQYILPQGRAVYKKPEKIKEVEESEKDEDEEDEPREEEEEEPEVDGTEETGPPLLTPVSSDKPFGSVNAWTVAPTSRLQSRRYSGIHLRSNRWPGAHAVYDTGRFASIYLGDALKELDGIPHTVPILPKLMDEWGAIVINNDLNSSHVVIAREQEELKEQDDPTLAEEKAHEEKMQEREIDNQDEEKSIVSEPEEE